MSRKRSRLWRYAGWAAWAALRYGRTAVGMPKPYASHRMPSAKGVGDAGRPLVDRVEGGRCDRDRVGGRQRARVTGCAPGRTYGVAGPGLHRLGVHEAEALRSGDYAHVPVRLLGRRDQLADLARYAGPRRQRRTGKGSWAAGPTGLQGHSLGASPLAAEAVPFGQRTGGGLGGLDHRCVHAVGYGAGRDGCGRCSPRFRAAERRSAAGVHPGPPPSPSTFTLDLQRADQRRPPGRPGPCPVIATITA